MVLIAVFLVVLSQLASAQGNRIRDKAQETSLTGTEMLALDRPDYGPIKYTTLSLYKTWILSGLDLHSDIGSVNTTGWLEGQVLKFNASGVLIPADDATGGTGGGAVVISDLTDVNTAGSADNHVLRKVGTTWVPMLGSLENFRQIGNSLNGLIVFDQSQFDGEANFNDEIKINNNFGDGKVFTSDAWGYGYWEDLPVKGVLSGTGIWIGTGGAGLPKPEFKPSTIPLQSDPLAAYIKFPIDYNGDPRLVEFQAMSTLMREEQTYMTITPQTSIIMYPENMSTFEVCSISVTLTDGEGATIPITTGDDSDFALTGNYCTPYFDDIDNNTYKFCIYQFLTPPDWPEFTSVTVTHTPSGVAQTWHVEW